MTQADTRTTAVANKVKVQNVRPSLTFKEGTEEAVNFYVSLFPNSKVVSLLRATAGGPLPEGSVLHASFVLDGQEYTAFDGGPSFSFTEAFSFVATCETQDEIDEVWARLTDGGEEGPCGWLKDRWGVSWQVVPTALGQMMSDPKSGNPAKVMEALLKMRKLDLATLEQAYRSGA
ncbi:MAG: VOC family protein [Chloroflexi bacterium]|nr:MAG: VOC family protein [Chloroflexota bacterium]TME79995.1 MAG: VOC family protein [Chloroflexota bacterium]TMF98595.1 MAG: VOC family protein [Chloroflexota bacterium]